MKKQLLHTPEGVRDIYNEECEKKLLLQSDLLGILKGYGYHPIQTPTFEFFDIFGKGASFMGTTVVGLASQAFGSINIGVSAIVFLFLAGALFFMKTEHSGSESMKNQENIVMGQQMFHD